MIFDWLKTKIIGGTANGGEIRQTNGECVIFQHSKSGALDNVLAALQGQTAMFVVDNKVVIVKYDPQTLAIVGYVVTDPISIGDTHYGRFGEVTFKTYDHRDSFFFVRKDQKITLSYIVDGKNQEDCGSVCKPLSLQKL